MELEQQINDLQNEIDQIIRKGKCKCGKTLYFYDDKYIYIKCKFCNEVEKVVYNR